MMIVLESASTAGSQPPKDPSLAGALQYKLQQCLAIGQSKCYNFVFVSSSSKSYVRFPPTFEAENLDLAYSQSIPYQTLPGKNMLPQELLDSLHYSIGILII